MERLTTNKKAKTYNVSLKEICCISKQSKETIRNWHLNKKELFHTVCMGIWHIKHQKDIEESVNILNDFIETKEPSEKWISNIKVKIDNLLNRIES